MSTTLINTLRTIFLTALLLPLLTFAQTTPTAPQLPAFMKDVKTEADFNKLTPAQQEEVMDFVKVQNSTLENSKSNIIANVNLQNAKIVSQKDGVYNISFELANGEGVQTGVKYSISLIKETNKGQLIVDTKVYNDTITLTEQSTVQKEISYTVPAGLSGEYTLFLKSSTDSGLVLGIGSAGKITLAPTLKSLEILTDSCFLQVQNEKGAPKYTLLQGVDIDNTESLQLSCDVQNYSGTPLSATPVFETHFRTLYGDVVPTDGGTTEAVQFPGNKKETIILTLPKAKSAQAYDVRVALKTGDTETNAVVAHYVLVGGSATIQNVILDKEAYQAGDTAKVSFVWSPAADSFPNSRHSAKSSTGATVAVAITDNGTNCIAPQDITLTGVVRQELMLPITTTCAHPLLSLSLKDAQGTVLDARTLKTTEPEAIAPTVIQTVTSFWSMRTLIILLTTLSSLILLYALYATRARLLSTTVLKSLVLTLVIAGSVVGGVGKAEAVTFTADWTFMGTTYLGWNLTANLAATVYSPSASMSFSFTSYFASCGNSANQGTYTVTLVNRSTGIAYGSPTSFNTAIVAGGDTVYDSLTLTAPAVAGNYRALISFSDWSSYTGSAFIDFDVTASVVNGACGLSSGASLASAPTTGLCTAGAASTVTDTHNGYGPWSWTCGGSGGGTTANCSAQSNAIGGFDWVDPSTCTVSGWAADTDNPTASISTHVYQDNSAFLGGTIVSGCMTSTLRSDINTLLNVTGNHGFTCTLPATYIGTGNHDIYIHAIDDGGGGPNNVIWSSPRALNCPLPPSATITAPNCTIPNGASSCTTNVVWTSSGVTGSPNVTENGTSISTLASGSDTRTISGVSSHTYKFFDGATQLSSVIASASCVTGTRWNGTSCQPPTITFDVCDAGGSACAPTANVIVNTPLLLKWSSNGDHCSAVTGPGFSISPSTLTTGTDPIVANGAPGLDTYTIVCDYDGVPISTKSVTVTTLNGPTITATPRIVDTPPVTTLTWDVFGQSGCNIDGGTLHLVSVPSTGSQTGVPIAGRTTFTLTCPIGAPNSVTVEIVPKGYET